MRDLRVSSGDDSGSSTISAFWKNDFFTAFLTCLPFVFFFVTAFFDAESSSLLKKPNWATAKELRATTLRACTAPEIGRAHV